MPGRRIAPGLSRLAAGTRGPRILLLTSSLGCGHLRAAEAIAAGIRSIMPAAEIEQLDFWSLMNPGVAAILQEKYLELVLENPELYARLHRLDERTWRRVVENDIPPPAEVIELIELATSKTDNGPRSNSSLFEWALGPYASDLLLYPTACAAMPTSSRERAGNNVAMLRLALLKWAFLRLQSRTEQRLAAFQPDAIVATQMVPAAIVSACKTHTRRWAHVPLIGVLTDFGAHDYWAQPGIDLYCVPHETIAGPPLIEGAAATSQRIFVTGVPLMPAFAAPPDAAATRRQLGFAADERVVLVLGGGLGLGLDDVVKTLLRDTKNCTIVVVTGKNDAARRRLQVAARAHGSRLHVHGWTEHMERYIVAADLVIGKPGGLTVAEVLACGRPLLVTRSLRGQESFNVRFLERARVGRYIAEPELSECVTRLFADPAELRAMQQRAWCAGRRDGAAKIARRAVELSNASIATMDAPASGVLNGHG